MKKKFNDSHLAFIAIGLVVILSLVVIINITSLISNYGRGIVDNTGSLMSSLNEQIENGLEMINGTNKENNKIYVTQVKITSSGVESAEEGYTVYEAYCEQFDEDILISVEDSYADQIKEGWKYRVSREVYKDTEYGEYNFIFNGEVQGNKLDMLSYNVTSQLEGLVVDKIKSVNNSGNDAYIVKVAIEDEERQLYITMYTDEEKFDTFNIGEAETVLKKEAQVGFNTIIIDYTLK